MTLPELFSGQTTSDNAEPAEGSWCVFVLCVLVLLLAAHQSVCSRPSGLSSCSHVLIHDEDGHLWDF